MWYSLRAAYDQRDVSLFKLLPINEEDEGEFMRFVYPLRARAAVFLSVLQIAFTLINTLVAVTARGKTYGGLDIFTMTLNLSVYMFLLLSAIWGTPSFLMRVVHGWYALIAILRIVQIVRFAFLGATISLDAVVAYGFYVLLIDLAVGTTMHIYFPLLLILTAVEMSFIGAAIYNSTLVDSGLRLDLTAGITLVLGFYVIVLWTIHTVQYNTVMMHVWNQKYQRERLDKDAQRRLEELDRLHLANTLHDIGCPLQAFVNGLDEVQEFLKRSTADGKIEQGLADTLGSMEASVTLMSLARRRAMLYAKSFNRVDALMPHREPAHLRYLVGECLKVIKAFSRSFDSNVPVNFHIDDDVPEVIMADSDWIVEGLTNYLSNAIKFTEAGSIDLKLSLRHAPPIHPPEEESSVSAHGIPRVLVENMKMEDITYVHFEVRDTGRGIPEEFVAKLFQPFSQLQSDISGTGLGLLSVRTKIELLHGTVGVAPNYPRGSIFWFDIPLDTAVPPSSPKDGIELPMSKSNPSSDSPFLQPFTVIYSDEETPGRRPAVPEEIISEFNLDTSQIKVLLVEDEKMLMRFSSKKFSDLGFTVTEATDGAHALAMMERESFDVVLMDQNMPQLGGLESIRRFREWERNSDVRGSSSRADAEVGRSDQKSLRTLSLSAWSEDKPPDAAIAPQPPEERPAHSPLLFMMSGSILDADKLEATELGVLDYFEKPLRVSFVAARILSHIVQQPARLERVQRQPTADHQPS